MKYEALIQSSEKLMQHNNEANVKKREMIEYDFYKDMKPFVDMVDEELKVWKELAYEWIKEEKPKYIHVQQIDQVYDNLQTNVLQCFVNKGKGKRFFETHQAISYTLQNIIEQLSNKRGNPLVFYASVIVVGFVAPFISNSFINVR